LARDLPAGVNYSLVLTSQQSSISLTTLSNTVIGQNYSISINNTRFDFTTTAVVAAANDHIGQGLAAAVNAATNDFIATYTTGNILIEVGPTGQPGNSFIISTTQPINSSVTFGTPVASPLSKILSIFGAPSITGTGLFVYNLETQATQPGCETRIATGTIEVLDSASINIVQGLAINNGVCGTSDFNGVNAIVMEYDNAFDIQLSPSSPNNLPNGLALSRNGTFNQFEISGTMNQVVTSTMQWDVDFVTTGASCSDVTQRITFNIEPTPIVSLTTTLTLGTDRTLCVSETMIPIRFEIANPAFTLTVTPTGTDPFPTGIVGQSFAQNQITRVQIMQGGLVPTSTTSDTFTINVNGTPYVAESGSQLANTSNITQLTAELVTFYSAQLSPTIQVTDDSPFIQFEAVNAGVAFSLSALSSSSLVFDTPTVTQPPAFYEISGTPQVVIAGTTDYVYTLQSVGAGGSCAGAFVASGTIRVNPTTSASFASGAGVNPVFCDIAVNDTSVFQATGNPIAITRNPATAAWITAAITNPITQEITVSYNPPILGVTSVQSFTYEFNLIGNNFGCTTTPSPITGIVYISPQDAITFVGIAGEDQQTV